MTERLKATMPLAVAVGLLTFIWLEVALNFTFHWVTNGELGNGLNLPGSFHLVAPAAFISWATYFAAGPERPALKALLSSVIGAVAALILMWAAPGIADIPDFWGIALVTALIGVVAVAASATTDLYYTPGVFGSFAAVVFWWLATGLDNWAPGGGGTNTLKALADPTTAGTGAFGGVISTPVEWVFLSCTVSLTAGVLLGVASVKLATAFTVRAPQEKKALATEAA